MNGQMPLRLTVAASLLIAGLMLWWQPYSADWPGSAYARSARRYVAAALRQDSSALRRLSTSATPVGWALRVARGAPDSLRAWAGGGQAWVGEHRGDTTQVFFYPPGDACSESPIVFRFVGSGSAARVVAADSRCLPSGR
jgi:hypothetical protein